MTNHASAEKALRQNITNNERNSARRSRMRTYIKKAANINRAEGYEVALANFVKAQSELSIGVQKGVIHKNAASRKIARLHKKLKSLQ